jgi:hypothetical protein
MTFDGAKQLLIAVFLASDDSHWLTGQRILASSGQTF